MMHWLKTYEERVGSIEDPNTPIAKALMFLGDMRTTITGRPMNDGAALSLAAFYNGVTIIAGDLATSSLKLYRRTDDGGKAEERGHALWDLLTGEPYPMVTTSSWREAMMGHLLLRGNSYSRLHTNRRGVIQGIEPLFPNVQRKGEVYEVSRGTTREFIHAVDMLHIPGPGGNGIDGWSVITLARENLSLAAALEESNTRHIVNASRPSGFISTPEPLSPEAVARLKVEWKKKNAGLDNVGNVPVLDNGMTWQQIQLNAEDAQFLETRKFSVTDVCRWLNITPHKLKDLERATFSNVEELQIDHVRSTLRPWAVRLEQCMNAKLLTTAERRAGLFIEHNLDSLLRGDTERRADAQRTYVEIGAMTPNEVRVMENRNPMPGGDRTFIRLDMVPLDKIDQVQSVTTDEEGRTQITFREQRAERRNGPDMRLALRNAFIALFLESAGRMVGGERRDILRLVKKVKSGKMAADALRDAIEAYYFDEHPPFATRVMQPVFRSYAESVSGAAAAEIDSDVRIDSIAHADLYTETFVARYSANSRRALADLAAEEVEARLGEWRDGGADLQPRHEQVAHRELVRMGDAVAKATWFGAGVGTLIWRAVGDTCPYCRRLDGKVVGITEPFIEAGAQFEGEGTDVPLVPKSNVGHAPAHRGCDCTIVPG